MAHSIPMVEAAVRYILAPPRSTTPKIDPAAIHCKSCFLQGEQCIASSSSTGDPLDPANSRLLPAAVRAQIAAYHPASTPPTSISSIRRRRMKGGCTTSEETLYCVSPNSVSSDTRTLLPPRMGLPLPSPRMGLPPLAPRTLRAPGARSWFDGEPTVDWNDKRTLRRHILRYGVASEGSGLQWIEKTLLGLKGGIMSFLDKEAGDGDDAESTETAQVSFYIPEEFIRCHFEDDFILVNKCRRGRKWKGKERESEYVQVEYDDASRPEESRRTSQELSERASPRSSAGRRAVERAKGALGSMRKRKEEASGAHAGCACWHCSNPFSRS